MRVLDLAHVGRLRVAIEERPRRLAGIVTGLGEGLSHETIVGAVLRAMIAHPVRQFWRGFGLCHRDTYLIGAVPVRQVRSNPLLQRKGVVAIHHTQWIDRILIKIGPMSEASYDGREEKDAAALQRRANLQSATFSTSVHGRTSRRRQATE